MRRIRINLRADVGTDKVTNKKYNQIFQKEEENTDRTKEKGKDLFQTYHFLLWCKYFFFTPDYYTIKISFVNRKLKKAGGDFSSPPKWLFILLLLF